MATRNTTPKRGSSNTPKKRAATRKRTPAKRAAAKRAPRKRTASSRAKGRPAVTSKRRAAAAPISWRRWLLFEAATVAAGVALGGCIAGSVLWTRATGDVASYVAEPPRTVPSVIWSAPMQVRVGQHASVPSLAGDLLAAGYERVDTVQASGPGPGAFSVHNGRFDIWTSASSGPVSEGRVQLTIADDRVRSASTDPVLLRPTVLGTIGDLESRRTEVRLADLSPWIEPALLAMEDVRFREHHGIDPVGVLRAVTRNVLGSGATQGGSTLTQQLAKNLFLTPERTLQRKVREAVFAAALETELSKDELLELYLGEVYLGQMGGLPLYGVEPAARAWFGVSAGRLELHQVATVIGVIPAPNATSPVRDPERARERRDLVLQRLHDLGHIDEAQRAQATAEPLVLVGLEPSRIRRAPYAVDAAVHRAEQALGTGALVSGGYNVHTHLQPLWQRAAEQAVADGMSELDGAYPKAAGAQVALVAVRVRDGAVVAMVGGRSYASSPFNRATSAWRQVGSTVKPLTLLEALDQRQVTAASRIDDQPLSRRVDGTPWTPANYDGAFLGTVTVRQAIEGSRNIPAIHLAEGVGATRLRRHLRDAGLSRATALPSAALGAFAGTPLEMAGAYTAFHGGTAFTPQLLSHIRTGDDAEVLALAPEGHDIANADAAAVAVRVLEGVISRGTGARAAQYGVHPPAAGKTGTTDAYRDAWFVGLTPELAVAVWVGRDEGTLGLSGSRAALPTWARFVAASGTNTGRHPRPSGIEQAEVCRESGRAARKACPERISEWFETGTVPDDSCDVHGAPTVKVGRLFGRLFGGGDKRDAKGNVRTSD